MDDGEYQLALTDAQEPTKPSGPSIRRQAQANKARQPSFFCWPLLAVLAVTLTSMLCLFPLSMFFDFPKGLVMLWGIGMIFGGIFWFGFRFKNLTGEGWQDESPWFLRGGLTTMLQLTGYVIQEPVIFGPPFSVLVLGCLLTVSPVFIPDLRSHLRVNPVFAMNLPVAPTPTTTTNSGEKMNVESSRQEPLPSLPSAKVPLSLTEAFATSPTVYLTDLVELDVQAGPCPIGKNGNLGNGSRIAIQGKESPKGLGMHPPDPPAVAKASFRVDQQRAILRGGVALNDTAETPWGAAVFAIHADGKLLWRSQPIKSRGGITDFQVDVEGADMLELSVLTEGVSHYVHAVWVEPRLIKYSH